jgi:hypothetical protein
MKRLNDSTLEAIAEAICGQGEGAGGHLRDFHELMANGVIEKRGTTGRSIHYVLKRQTRHKPDNGDTR